MGIPLGGIFIVDSPGWLPRHTPPPSTEHYINLSPALLIFYTSYTTPRLVAIDWCISDQIKLPSILKSFILFILLFFLNLKCEATLIKVSFTVYIISWRGCSKLYYVDCKASYSDLGSVVGTRNCKISRGEGGLLLSNLSIFLFA